jgi:hypothetical protein
MLAEFQRIMDLLAAVAAGTFRIPNLALRGDLRPSMSNVEVDRRYRHSTIRRTQENSTDGGSSLPEHHADEAIPYG